MSPTPTPAFNMIVPNDSSVFVGSLTGKALSTSLIGAMNDACLDKSFCLNSSYISIEYPDDANTDGINTGDLEVQIYGEFLDDVMKKNLFEVAAQLAVAAADNEKTCFNITVSTGGPRVGTRRHEHHVCNMCDRMLLEYYSGTRTDGPDGRLWIEFTFTKQDGGADMTDEVCMEAVMGIQIATAIVGLFFPALRPALNYGENIAAKGIHRACAAAADMREKSGKGSEKSPDSASEVNSSFLEATAAIGKSALEAMTSVA